MHSTETNETNEKFDNKRNETNSQTIVTTPKRVGAMGRVSCSQLASNFSNSGRNAGGGTGFESFRYVQASAKSKAVQETIHRAVMDAIGGGVIDRGTKTGVNRI